MRKLFEVHLDREKQYHVFQIPLRHNNFIYEPLI